MRSSQPPLPIKWFVVSFAGAIVLAFGLMTVFEIRIGSDPDPSPVTQSHVDKVSQSPPQILVATTHHTTSRPDRVDSVVNNLRKRESSLWSMLVTPELVTFAMAVAIVGAAISAAPNLMSRLRRSP